MKKLLLFVAVLFVSTTSYAQLGIVGGLTSTSSNIKVAASELTTKMLSQYHVGLSYKIGLGKVFAIQPGVIYNVKGTTLADFEFTQMDFKTGYVEVPVQLQVGASLGKVVRLYAIAEPFVGYAVSNKVQIEGTSQQTWDNIKNRFEYGIGAGAGIELFDRVQVNLKYFWNFGQLYGKEFSFLDIPVQIGSTSCGGITLSAVILLF